MIDEIKESVEKHIQTIRVNELPIVFNEPLHFDSLDAFELAMLLEDEFDIQIPDEKIESFETAQQIVDYIVSEKEKEE